MTVQQPPSPRPGIGLRTVRVLQTTFSVAVLLATLFVFFSPKMFSTNLTALISAGLNKQPEGAPVAYATQSAELPIGIVSGHWGNGDDPGAVCPDGANEHDVNLAIASLVRQKLEAYGYQVDLLQEFDSRLDGYNAEVLLAIHTDTCDAINDQATGFKVASSTYSHDANLANRLTACLDNHYAAVTGLKFNPGGITENMTDYHAFRAVNPATPAAIIETGFLYLDKKILVGQPDLVADGIVEGILCFVKNQSVSPVVVPTP
ncbi:MAG TPA: N-acetylmuramoyl-L-alanine amidase [Anaerolineales bacterium]|nr:N-acetylmuramoyl-L-alanine amidase [Anaerolineales bacterium]